MRVGFFFIVNDSFIHKRFQHLDECTLLFFFKNMLRKEAGCYSNGSYLLYDPTGANMSSLKICPPLFIIHEFVFKRNAVLWGSCKFHNTCLTSSRSCQWVIVEGEISLFKYFIINNQLYLLVLDVCSCLFLNGVSKGKNITMYGIIIILIYC